MRRFGGVWGKLGVFLLCTIVLAVAGFSVFAGTDLLSNTVGDRAERAVEPEGAKQDPPKPAEEPEKEEKKETKQEQKKDTSDKEQREAASKEPEVAPEKGDSEPLVAPVDTTMYLDVPSIGLSSVPVYEGASEASLYASTGHLAGTGYPWVEGSNTYVAGHRIGYPGTGSDHIFWDLPSVAIGDPVMLTDANGQTYEYEVNEILEVPITDLSVTEPTGDDVVSLQTCIEDYGDYWTAGPNWYVRYVVRASKVSA